MISALFPSAKTDEACTQLEEFIEAQKLLAKVRDESNALFHTIVESEADERVLMQAVNNLEGNIKSYGKRVFLGEVKSGGSTSLKDELGKAQESLETRRHVLSAQRELFCSSQEALSQITTDMQKLHDQLQDSLPAAFAAKFGQEDTSSGKRGQIVWLDPEPNSERNWKAQWRNRTFQFLYFKVLNCSERLDLVGALAAFLSGASFEVRIVSGFVLKSGAVLESGCRVSVPSELDFECAFEEVSRGRAVFVCE